MTMTIERTILAAVLAVAIGSSLGGAFAKDKEFAWGAIAVDLSKPDRAPEYGLGGGQNEADAKEAAIEYCQEAAGKKSDCKVVVAYQQCGAYAASKKGGGYGINTTKKTAEAKAMSGCDDDSCKLVVSDCN
jgi:hypothetical protein